MSNLNPLRPACPCTIPSVSILVLMDVELKPAERGRYDNSHFVSILVLMDVELKQIFIRHISGFSRNVSILVLMDVELKPCSSPS